MKKSETRLSLIKTIVAISVIVLLLQGVVVVAFIYSGIYDVRASSPHGSIANWILRTTMHASIESRAEEVAEQVEVPDLSDPSLLLAGANDFEQMCARCHGAPGREPDAVGKGLNPPPPDLAESAAHMTAAELFVITKHGIRMTGMPAWGETHPDEALWPVVAFMTKLPELDTAAYDQLLESAAGEGHHANDAGGSGASQAGEESPHGHEGDESTEAEEESEAEHDHSSHEH